MEEKYEAVASANDRQETQLINHQVNVLFASKLRCWKQVTTMQRKVRSKEEETKEREEWILRFHGLVRQKVSP